MLTLSQLVSIGSHIGEISSRRHPRAGVAVAFSRSGLCVLDQIRSLSSLRRSLPALISTFYNNGSALFMGFDSGLTSLLDSLRFWSRSQISANRRLYHLALATYIRTKFFHGSESHINDPSSIPGFVFDSLLKTSPLSFPSQVLGWKPKEEAFSNLFTDSFSPSILNFFRSQSLLGKFPFDNASVPESSKILFLSKLFHSPFKSNDPGNFRVRGQSSLFSNPGNLFRHYYLSHFRIYGSLTNLSSVYPSRSQDPDFRHFHRLPQFVFLFDVGRANAPFIREASYIKVPLITSLDSDMDGGLSNFPLFSNNDRATIARFWHTFFTFLTAAVFRLDLGTLYLSSIRSRLKHGHLFLDVARFEIPLGSSSPRTFSIPEVVLVRPRLKRFISILTGSLRPTLPFFFSRSPRVELLRTFFLSLRGGLPVPYGPGLNFLSSAQAFRHFKPNNGMVSSEVPRILDRPYFRYHDLGFFPGSFSVLNYLYRYHKGALDWEHYSHFATRGISISPLPSQLEFVRSSINAHFSPRRTPNFLSLFPRWPARPTTSYPLGRPSRLDF